nr:MAG TPA: RNA polymerase-like protein [Caudoviricetes sp.]
MSKEVACPHCGACNTVAEFNDRDMREYGKTVFCCCQCDKLFTLRDDGDGEFISSRQYPRSK